MVFLFLLHFPIFPFPIFPISHFSHFSGFFRFFRFFQFFPVKTVFFGFPFDLGKFDLGIPDIPHIPEIFDLGIFAHFFLVVVSAHFGPIPPFPILLIFQRYVPLNSIKPNFVALTVVINGLASYFFSIFPKILSLPA